MVTAWNWRCLARSLAKTSLRASTGQQDRLGDALHQDDAPGEQDGGPRGVEILVDLTEAVGGRSSRARGRAQVMATDHGLRFARFLVELSGTVLGLVLGPQDHDILDADACRQVRGVRGGDDLDAAHWAVFVAALADASACSRR